MNTKKRTIIGILAMIIVLTVSAGCLFGCGSSDEGEKDSDKEQSQNADEDENDEDDDGDEKSGKSSYSIVVGDLVDAFFKEFDAEKIVNLMPEKAVELTIETQFNGDRKKFIKAMQSQLDEVKEAAEEQGYDLSKLEFNIVSVEDVDKADVEKMNKNAKEAGFDLKLKEVKSIEIEVTIPSEDGEEETNTLTLQVAKIGNAWYVIDFK